MLVFMMGDFEIRFNHWDIDIVTRFIRSRRLGGSHRWIIGYGNCHFILYIISMFRALKIVFLLVLKSLITTI